MNKTEDDGRASLCGVRKKGVGCERVPACNSCLGRWEDAGHGSGSRSRATSERMSRREEWVQRRSERVTIVREIECGCGLVKPKRSEL